MAATGPGSRGGPGRGGRQGMGRGEGRGDGGGAEVQPSEQQQQRPYGGGKGRSQNLYLAEDDPMWAPALTDEDLDNDPPGHKSGYVAVIGKVRENLTYLVWAVRTYSRQ